MKSLRVEARLHNPILLPSGTLALDGLLAAAVAMRDNLPPPVAGHVPPLEVPLQREPGGRFHLASFAVAVVEERELRYTNRRFPMAEAQSLAEEKVRRISLSSGPNRGYRIPIEVGHLEGDSLTWWCVGEEEEVRALLHLITHLGKRRAVDYGRVRKWVVEECAPWGEGFPVLREGRPLRPLPLDWPGLSPNVERGYATLTYPYWERHREVECAVPAACS